VINNTEIEMGEGIAGMAAATAESIILPKDEGKNHLSDKMKRRYINSSLIVPFNKADARSVYGVINLNITRKDMQFSDRDIQLVKSLVNMISVALIPLRRSNESSGEPQSHSDN
ncbi:MAG: GAF domain-containing protein, partial [Candidatus Omnitrophica bacterium]|nr:GAF domain-containing protein [Candidatus Omnitrophota bacterium]